MATKEHQLNQRVSSSRRVILNGLVILVVTYVLWITLIYLLQDKLIFPRWAISNRALPEAPAGIDEWTIETEEGPVHAWFLVGGGRSATSPGGVVVMLHGNGMLIDDWLNEAGFFTALGWNVLLPEFRGYGRAAGNPSEKALRADIVAFMDLLAERPEVDPSRIVYYGRSIGGSLAAIIAEERPPRSMILQTPPASIAEMSWRYGAPPILVRSPFDAFGALSRSEPVPILLLEHDRDTVVPASHSRRILEAAPQAQHVVLKGDHNMLKDAAEEAIFYSEVERFLNASSGDAGR